MKSSILRECLRISRQKNTPETHPEFGNYHHFSFLVIDNKIVYWATNRKDGVDHLKYGYKPTSKKHAEYEVLRKYRKDVDAGVIINIRLSKKGETKISAPCKVCTQFLQKQNITKVYYSIESDKFEYLKL